MAGLQRDLDEYLHDYNFDRAHTGRLTQALRGTGRAVAVAG